MGRWLAVAIGGLALGNGVIVRMQVPRDAASAPVEKKP
jgi:hypothetical protein